MTAAEAFDVVVVGAGSGGGVVASRLSEDERLSVLLLEAGPDFPDELTRTPGFFASGNTHALHGVGGAAPIPDMEWGHLSEPVFGGRRINLRAAKVAGGGSMINGCIAVRGRPEDFARWEAAGARGWGWNEMLPFYEQVEREVTLQRYPRSRWLPIQAAFADAMQELGYRWCDDLNAPDAWDGVVGQWPQNRRNEIRHGTLTTYIRKARPRKNFTIRGGVTVDRVLLEGDRAVGVAVIGADGKPAEIRADRIILSAGAYGSVPILLRSGIGPSTELRALGITAVADLPVGRSLMQHMYCNFTMRTSRELAQLGGPKSAVAARGDGWWAFGMPVDEEEGVCAVNFHLAEVDGAGRVTLRSPRVDVLPLIDHLYADYLRRPDFDGPWALFEQLLATTVMRERGVRDGRGGRSLAQVLEAGLGQGGHQAGGCAIGTVVDPDLRVHGIRALHVADASVFPSHVTNNPNLTVMALGEYAAVKLRAAIVAG